MTARDVAESSLGIVASHQGLPNEEIHRNRVNTLLVVATLVATVTFAAGFTMPGGYSNSVLMRASQPCCNQSHGVYTALPLRHRD
ncbi:hypothetical protein ACFX11_025788 [Malus domestica]